MITVLFQTESHYPVDRQKIKDAITNHLKGVIESDAEVSVTIIGNRRMHQLNKTFRQKDYPTDVLSFPQSDPSQPDPIPFVEPPDDTLRLGDIVISYPKAVEEAAEENKFVDDQIVFLVLHGLEHLLGHHHAE